MMQTIQSLPQPVIASVHGIATAAGCQLVASCDMAVAAHGTRFGVNGVNIGLFCSTPMVALSRNIGRKKAFELLTTGRFLSCGEAEALGLIAIRAGRDAPLPTSLTTPRARWPKPSPASWAPPSRSASRRSIPSCKCRWIRPMPIPAT